MLFIRLIANGILSKWSFLVFHRERIPMQPDDCRMTSQGLFSIQLPAPKMHITESIQSSEMPGRIENPMQLFRSAQLPRLLAEHFRRTKTVFCNARRECCIAKRARLEKYYSVPPWYSNGNVSILLRMLRVFAIRSRTIIGRLIGS